MSTTLLPPLWPRLRSCPRVATGRALLTSSTPRSAPPGRREWLLCRMSQRQRLVMEGRRRQLLLAVPLPRVRRSQPLRRAGARRLLQVTKKMRRMRSPWRRRSAREGWRARSRLQRAGARRLLRAKTRSTTMIPSQRRSHPRRTLCRTVQRSRGEPRRCLLRVRGVPVGLLLAEPLDDLTPSSVGGARIRFDYYCDSSRFGGLKERTKFPD
mmetsp:Transcript_27559/g.68081  ORF Transcript_27559/g.68081 Transcript_27559/m.68081 type:complete len:211 (-) Transcript_27559:169-801(-)